MSRDEIRPGLAFSDRFLRIVYIAAIFGIGLSARGAAYTKLKGGIIPFIFCAAIDFCFRFRLDSAKTIWAFLKKYAQYILLLTIVSLVVYVSDASTTALILRGLQKIFYQILTVFGAVCAVYEFRKKAPLYTYYGMVLANAFMILVAAKETGSVGQIVSDFKYFLTSGFDAQGFMRILELHEDTFAFGVLMVWFMLDGIRKNKWKLLVCMFFFFLGFKRIGMFGIFVAAALYLLSRKLSDDSLKKLMMGIMIVMMVYGFLYVWFVRSGNFVKLMDELGIDLMGRQNLYKFIEDYYVISPLFMGHGFESIEHILKGAGDIKVANTYISRMSALHCDYLAMYIQMGFIGYIAWMYYRFIDVTHFCGKYGRKAMLAWALSMIYLGITYMTDNTSMYFLPCMVQFMIPLAFAIKKGEDYGSDNQESEQQQSTTRLQVTEHEDAQASKSSEICSRTSSEMQDD